MRSQTFLVAFLSLILGIQAYWLADISRKTMDDEYILVYDTDTESNQIKVLLPSPARDILFFVM